MQLSDNSYLQGKVAFISGGTSGINFGVAKALVSNGANVLIFGRNESKATKAADDLNEMGVGKAIGATADVRDAEMVHSLFKKTTLSLGKPDIIIAGAAGNFLADVSELSTNAFKSVVDIDLLGTYNVFKAGHAYVNKPNGIMLALSAPQAIIPTRGQAHACAAKAGINMLVKCLALEWGVEGIRVNAISPGPIKGTEGVERLAPSVHEKSNWAARLALKRLGTMEEIVNAIIFLLTPYAQYMTGTTMDFDGGSQLGNNESFS